MSDRVLSPELEAPLDIGRLPLDQLVTVHPFADIERAIEDTRSGRAVKAVLETTPAADPRIIDTTG